LQENELLFKDQFGFRRKISTSSALLQFIDSVLKSMDEGHVSGVVYVNWKKAFGTVDHSLLLSKLTAYGVAEASLKWFPSYPTLKCQINGGGVLINRGVEKNSKI